VQGFGRPVVLEGTQHEIVFLFGNSAKSFTPDTADMSVTGTLFLASIQERNSRKAKRVNNPEKDIGIQKIKKTSFGLEVSVI